MSSQRGLSVKLSKRYTYHLFAIKCDETTDVDQLAQSLVYVRFVGPSSIEEEILLCRPLETTIKADVIQTVAIFLTRVAWNGRNLWVSALTVPRQCLDLEVVLLPR